MTKITDNIALEAKRIEEDAEHSAKGQYNASSRWSAYHYYIGIPDVLIGAVSAAAAFQNYSKFAGAFALVAAAFAALLTFLKPSERAQLHKNAGHKYLSLRNQTRMFREIERCKDADASEAKNRLLELAEIRDNLNQESPTIARRDYVKAKDDIDNGYATYKVDEIKR